MKLFHALGRGGGGGGGGVEIISFTMTIDEKVSKLMQLAKKTLSTTLSTAFVQ